MVSKGYVLISINGYSKSSTILPLDAYNLLIVDRAKTQFKEVNLCVGNQSGVHDDHVPYLKNTSIQLLLDTGCCPAECPVRPANKAKDPQPFSPRDRAFCYIVIAWCCMNKRWITGHPRETAVWTAKC